MLSIGAAPLNPVRSGLPPHGIRDVHVSHEGGRWYLTGTEVPHPVHGRRGPTLYVSDDLAHWSEVGLLIDRSSLRSDVWYRDGGLAPEIHRIADRCWLVFHGRNDSSSPYGHFGVGLAVARQLEGPYEIVTQDAPLVRGSNPTLHVDAVGGVHLAFDQDGVLLAAPIDLGRGVLTAVPRRIGVDHTLSNGSHRLEVAPAIITYGDRVHLFYSRFAAGYQIHHSSAPDIGGPWTDSTPSLLFGWSEDDCDTILTAEYPPENTFAPPTEITGQVAPFDGPDGRTWFAYHSPDKYSEPWPCFDPVDLRADGSVAFDGRTIAGEPVDPQKPRLSYTPDVATTIPISPLYHVEIQAGGRTESIPVYWSVAQWKTNNSRDTAWASFELVGPTTVRVTRLDGAAVDYCAVLPASRGVVPKVSHSSVEFTLDRPGQVSVEFERGQKIAHPLLVFADPPEAPIPDDTDRVIRYGAGLHELSEPLVLRSGQTLHLARGAWVRGQVVAEKGEDIRICGRGVLDGIRHPARGANHMITFRDVTRATIEGITIVNAPRYNISLNGREHLVRNVKMIGWWFSTDGVSTGEHSVIEDCFFKVNDDAIKLYRSDTVARRCVIWQMENGAPFMISWNMPSDNARFHAHDIDVIRVEHEWDNPNLALITAIHGGPGVMSDYIVEDVRVDNCSWRPFHLVTRPNHFGAWHPEKGSLARFLFRNITFNGRPRIQSLVKGHDDAHPVSDVTFENLRINGRLVRNAVEADMHIDANTTSGVRFVVSLPDEGGTRHLPAETSVVDR
jgi:hypothetical protein